MNTRDHPIIEYQSPKHRWMYGKSIHNLSYLNSLRQPLSGQDWLNGGSLSEFDKLPFWLILPGLLHSKYATNLQEKESNNLFLSDILWAQICIFLSIRMKDDVIDLEIENPLFILISDLFLIETEQVLIKYFKREHNFWPVYFQLLKETIASLFEKEDLEAHDNSFNEKPSA